MKLTTGSTIKCPLQLQEKVMWLVYIRCLATTVVNVFFLNLFRKLLIMLLSKK